MERRRYPRGKSFYGGVIAFNARQSTLDCVVRNFSSAGAKIAMSGTVLLPDEFDLTIARKEGTFRARLVWRDGLEAGLRFTSDDDSRVISLDVSRKLRMRKAEIARLQRRVSELTDGQ
ncbi:PilZ domain-containing protein [Bradyrhizobium sp.]|uniref:PilZ domain-containing protein n=1 Tax=Bradyrhizobium sp. TaxID=376 RepID=UPI003C5C687A